MAALSARNLPNVTVVEAEGINVLDVVNNQKLDLDTSRSFKN
jgi:large subunit ribosomal protein L4